MKDSECLSRYEAYLKDVKNASANTLSSYLRDIRQLGAYFSSHSDCTFDTATEADLSEYIASLKSAGKSIATVSRAIASIKSFYAFLLENEIVSSNPSSVLVPDKTAQKLPQILTSKEVELLLEQPECVDAKGYRDRAMLELLYATGIRVSELKAITLESVNKGKALIRNKRKERVILIPDKLARALRSYAPKKALSPG